MPVGSTPSTTSVGRRRRLSSTRSDGGSTPAAPTTPPIPTPQEAEALFQTLTVAEMREKRKEYNSGVEAKRQELRMLVGKRYAGLIEVADGISEMKTSVEGVTSSISDLQTICRQLKNRQTAKVCVNEVETKTVPDSTKQFYSITAQIKLLVSLPSRICDALAQKNFTRASHLLLVGTHVHQGLRLDTTAPHATQIFPFFPVISHLWPSIARFRPLITSASRAQLTSPTLTSVAAVDALAAIVALEGVTLRQVFADFLIARSEALNQVFAASGTTSVKDQLTEGVSILLLSLKLVSEVFSPSERDEDASPSLLNHLNLLASTASPVLKSDILASCGATVGAALPASVLDFKPALRVKMTPLAAEQLLERCNKWFEVSVSSLRTSLSSQLAYVSSVKGLAHVRDVTADVLARPEISTDWVRVSTAVLGKEVCVWKEAIRPLVLERLEALLRERLRSSINALVDDLKDQDGSPSEENDILGFMWSESSSDIPRIAFGDGVVGQRRKGASSTTITTAASTESGSQLRMKTKGRTPKLQAICKKLDEQLEIFLEDARHFAVVKDAGSTVDLGEDVNFISSALTRYCYEAFQDFFAFIDEELEKTSNDVDSSSSKISSTSVRRLIFRGRVCEALTELTPRLFNALVPSAALVSDDDHSSAPENCTFLSASTRSSLSFRRSLLSASRQSMMTPSSTQPQDQSLFVDVKGDLLKRFWSAWDVWRRDAVDDGLEELGKIFGDKDYASILTTNRLTAWETAEIKDDDDDEGEEQKNESSSSTFGAATTSTSPLSSIRVPVQATAGLHRVLRRICRRINDAGGYVVPKPVVETLAEDFLRGAVDEFAKAVDDGDSSAETTTTTVKVAMNQTLATQLSFDSRFLLQLLSHRGTSDETRRRMDSFLSSLESFVDPFDLDLLNPHLHARVQRHAQRAAALYGLLATTANQRSSVNASSSSRGLVVANERASSLMLCGGSSSLGSRFPTIPLPTPGGGRDAALRRHLGGEAASSVSMTASAARRKEEEAKGEDKAGLLSSSQMHKAATWSSGLSKLTAREGSNSPSDFFKSGAALYVSWFGGGGSGNSE